MFKIPINSKTSKNYILIVSSFFRYPLFGVHQMNLNNFKIQNKYNFNYFNYSRKLTMEFNKKRKRLEEAEKEKKTNQDNNEDVNSMDESFELDENGIKRLNLPKKSKYRMRAHCNPLAGVSIA